MNQKTKQIVENSDQFTELETIECTLNSFGYLVEMNDMFKLCIRTEMVLCGCLDYICI